MIVGSIDLAKPGRTYGKEILDGQWSHAFLSMALIYFCCLSLTSLCVHPLHVSILSIFHCFIYIFLFTLPFKSWCFFLILCILFFQSSLQIEFFHSLFMLYFVIIPVHPLYFFLLFLLCVCLCVCAYLLNTTTSLFRPKYLGLHVHLQIM